MEAGPEAESFVNAVVGGRGVLEALVIDGPLLVYARCGPDDSALGKNANCQTLVSLTLARNEVPVMVALRLFLPESWTSDPVSVSAAHPRRRKRSRRRRSNLMRSTSEKG